MAQRILYNISFKSIDSTDSANTLLHRSLFSLSDVVTGWTAPKAVAINETTIAAGATMTLILANMGLTAATITNFVISAVYADGATTPTTGIEIDNSGAVDLTIQPLGIGTCTTQLEITNNSNMPATYKGLLFIKS